ncbi:MAG: GNAT family N-acetyltransferase [Lachnospiraceae bacterium]|nr:GNAT family N-acetyltransferase [Lachnospiraceae bacterium]
MYEKIYEIKSIPYQIRIIKESDLDSLLLVKGDVSVHTDRFRQQKDGKAVYLGAFINNCAIGYVLLLLDNKEDVMLYTNHEKCADMIDLLIIEPLRNYGIGSRLALACEEFCKENKIPYLGLDVNPTDNPAAKRLYERLGYNAAGNVHLDGVYEYTDEQGKQGKYEDWCIDMIKRM